MFDLALYEKDPLTYGS